MNLRLILIIYVLLLHGMHAGAQRRAVLQMHNPVGIERRDELVVISRKIVEQRIGKDVSFLSVQKGNKPLPVQFIDNDGDGKWDEFAVLYSFLPREKVSLNIVAENQHVAGATPARAHVRLRKKDASGTFGPQLISEEMPFQHPATDFSKQPLPLYLTEGPAWENDKVGFRLYFDVRNGKDIWGKTTSRMVLDSVGANPGDDYHKQSPWGMDVLKVGKSLGAGALALSFPQAGGRDTLVRLGGPIVKKAVYTQLADGPLLARMQLRYDCIFENSPFQLVEEISIWGGQFFYESKITIVGAPVGTQLVTGLPNLYPNKAALELRSKAAFVYSHGKQSENKDVLGMAIMVPRETYFNWETVNNPSLPITGTYLVAQNIVGNKPAVFRMYAGWEATEPRFADVHYFTKWLQQEADRFSYPIEIN